MGKNYQPWSLQEEAFIRDKAGIMSVGDIAAVLGRTRYSVLSHATKMRKEGRLNAYLSNRFEQEYKSYLTECCECHQMRLSVDRLGVCEVCRRKRQLKCNEATMHRAWLNLPPEYKQRAKRKFDPERAPKLMGKSLKLKMPQKPDVFGMDEFDAAAAMDQYLIDMERYELAILKLDIDAVKQRTCKWRRKTRAYEAGKKI